MVKLMLNLHKFNNYAFFCPVSRLHLTVSSPVGYTNEVTPAILRAIKLSTLIDVDGVIDIETGTVKDAQPVKTPKSPEKADNADIKQDNSSEQSEKITETPAPDEAPKARRGKGKKEATDTADEKAE